MALPSNIADPNQISALITGLIRSRDTIRTTIGPKPNGKWDITEAAGASLSTLASIIDGIAVNDNIDVDLMEGDTYNIPKGYHTGSGVVKGVAGGGNYTLQAKTVSAGRSDITVVPDQGKYGLSSVKVNAISSNLQDVSYVTATAGDVLVGKNIVTSNGTVTAGTMVNNGTVTQTLSTAATAYTIPQGYHSGSGKVSIKLEEKTATPSTATQTIVPTTGSVLSKVTVNAIPSPYYDVSGVTATAAQVLTGSSFVTSNGTLTAGTMTNKGAISQTLSTTSTQYTVPQGYHNGSGTVKIVTEDKTMTPTTAAQTVYPTAGKVFNKITVNAIPAPYYNTSGVTAVASHVLTGEKFVNSSGTTITGTMPNNQSWGATLDVRAGHSYITVPSGYHTGNGTVDIVPEIQEIIPSTSTQAVTPSAGKVLSQVTVKPIPSNYKNTTGADAVADNVLSGKKFVNTTGIVTGTMANNGAIATILDVRDGHTEYNIPAGYHNGAGAVTIIKETKSVTPNTSTQTITPTAGKVLSSVTVNAIPSPYYDVSGVTAAASQVLAGTSYVTSSGTLTSGTMVDRGAVNQTLSTTSTQYTVPQGYHSGSGTVKIVTEDKSFTPTTNVQTVYATAGKVINKVTVNAIPAPYYNTSGVTAVASHVLTGEKFVNSSGTTVTGTMADNSAVHKALTYLGGSYTEYTIPSGYHNGHGTVTVYFDDDPQITPSTTSRVLTPTLGAFGKVTIKAIPAPYYDVSGVTATASQVLAGTSYVTSAGALTAGTMTNRGAVNQTLSTTSTQYTVPQGYHNGAGTVKIVTETKSATPATSAQTIVATSGKVLSSVTVNAIPTQYKDTTDADAVAADVLSGKKFVNSTGTVTGTMAIQAGETHFLSTSSSYFTIPKGYHDGHGLVTVQQGTKTVTPTTSSQTVLGNAGASHGGRTFLSQVVVNAIPTKYKDTTDADAVAANVLSGKKFVNTTGTVTGIMANIGSQVSAIDGLTVASKLISQGYHDGTGYIYLTNDIEIALASI